MTWLLIFMMWQESVTNGLKPANPVDMSMETTLVLGTEDGGEEEIFGPTLSLVVDEDGTIFVLDTTSHRVAVFDKDGTFVRSFGKQGQGPGEFQGATAIALTNEDNLAIFDTGLKRMSIMKKDGTYVSEKRFGAGIQAIMNPYWFDNGNFMFYAVAMDANRQQLYDISIYDGEFKEVKNLLKVNFPPMDWSQMNTQEFWVGFLKAQFEAVINSGITGVAIDGKHAVVAQSNNYKGFIYDQTGELKSTFTREAKRKLFTDDAQYTAFEGIWQSMIGNPFLSERLKKPVFEAAVAATEDTDLFPYFVAVCRLGDGFAFLANYDLIKETGQFDVFDAKGNLLGTLPYEGPINTIYGTASGHIYTAGPDEDENIVIKRYTVKGL